MAFLTRSTFVAVTVACALAVQANVAPPDATQVKSELWSYFKNIERHSPTVLGGLAKSEESMAAIKQRIDSLSDTEVAKFQKMMVEAPDWRVAPEAFSTAFPPEMLDHIRNIGAAYHKQVPQAEKMRDEVGMLLEALRLAPDAKLAELGIDRKTLASLETTLEKMDPMQLAMLHRRATDATNWRQTNAAAIETLPPAFRRGAMELAKHGPLTEKDIAELEEFRTSLMQVMIRIEALPPEAKSKLTFGSMTLQIAQIGQAPPDVLFMIRHNVTPETIAQLNQNVAYLYAMSSFTDEEKNELEGFRRQLATVFSSLGGNAAETETMLAELDFIHLRALQERMGTFGEWQTVLPIAFQTAQSPEVQARLAAVRGPAPDPTAAASLEAYRTQALVWIDAVAARGDTDASLVESARQTITNAPLDQLELIRSTVEALPATATDKTRLSVASHISLNCNVTLIPQFTLGEVCIPPGCADPCFGVFGGCEFCWGESCTPGATIGPVTADLNFMCNPIRDAIHAIESSVTSTANAVVDTMRTGINTLITGMQTTVNNLVAQVQNTIDTVISGITSTINNVWSFLQTLPTTAWNAIKAALNLLLDIHIANGVTLRQIIQPLISGGANALEQVLESMHQMFGLAGNWWNAVANFTLPMIPCPPANFHTPFGDVGTRAAADNYARYRVAIDGLVNLIPETETSLFIKIPAQVIFTAFHFFGLCLDQAANDADSAQLTERHTLVVTAFANVNLFVSSQIVGLTSTYDANTTNILNSISAQSVSMQQAMTNHSVVLQGAVNSEANETHSNIQTESNSIKALIQSTGDQTQSALDEFAKLTMKLAIEGVLKAGNPHEITMFQLRPQWGSLQTVSSILGDLITAMSAAGETVGHARRYHDSGNRKMASGEDKDAFDEFVRAYRELTAHDGGGN